MTKDPLGGRVSKEVGFKYREVFGSEAGQEVLMDILKRFNFFSSTYDTLAKTNQLEMNMAEGRRQVALHILATSEVDPNQLMSSVRKEITNARRQ